MALDNDNDLEMSSALHYNYVFADVLQYFGKCGKHSMHTEYVQQSAGPRHLPPSTSSLPAPAQGNVSWQAHGQTRWDVWPESPGVSSLLESAS